MKEFEYKNVVYDVTNGPKVMIDNLNTNGKEGWQIGTSIVIGDGLQIVVVLQREINIQMPDPDESKKEDIQKLWGSG
jgi:hypothetical protein